MSVGYPTKHLLGRLTGVEMSSSTRTLPALLRAAAAAYADHAAYVEGQRQVSYRDLLHRVRETAAGYRSLGLGTGDRVVVWAPNSIEWAVAALAVSYAGGVLVPVNSRYVGPEVADGVARPGARGVVVHGGFRCRDQVTELADAGGTCQVWTLQDLMTRTAPSVDQP